MFGTVSMMKAVSQDSQYHEAVSQYSQYGPGSTGAHPFVSARKTVSEASHGPAVIHVQGT